MVRTISGRCPGISALSYRQHKRPISPWHWKPSETTTQQLSIAPRSPTETTLACHSPTTPQRLQPFKIDRSVPLSPRPGRSALHPPHSQFQSRHESIHGHEHPAEHHSPKTTPPLVPSFSPFIVHHNHPRAPATLERWVLISSARAVVLTDLACLHTARLKARKYPLFSTTIAWLGTGSTSSQVSQLLDPYFWDTDVPRTTPAAPMPGSESLRVRLHCCPASPNLLWSLDGPDLDRVLLSPSPTTPK